MGTVRLRETCTAHVEHRGEFAITVRDTLSDNADEWIYGVREALAAGMAGCRECSIRVIGADAERYAVEWDTPDGNLYFIVEQ